MPHKLADYIRDARAARGWSQLRAAQTAGIGRVTLNRWESGAQQPRVAELIAFLTALGADSESRMRVLSLLETAEGRHRLVKAETQAATAQRIGPMPCAADLLRALRLRRGVSLEQAARGAGVTTRTMRLWEKGEVEPSSDRLNALCAALNAHPREAAFLSHWRVGDPHDATRSPVELRERFVEAVCHYQVATEEMATELEFVALAAHAWRLAARSDEARLLLAEIHGHHAQYLCNRFRYAEAASYVRRSLNLLEGQSPNHLPRLRAAILAVRCDFEEGWSTALQATERLKNTLSPSLLPEYRAWVLANIATYANKWGTPDDALTFTEEAYHLAMRGDSQAELNRRRLDYAQGLLATNRAEECLPLLSPDQATCGETETRIYLFRARAEWTTGLSSDAQDSLTEAYARVARFGLAHLRAEVDAVAGLF